MRFYAENPGAVQAIRDEIARLEWMLSNNDFDDKSGETLFFPNNAEERRAKLQALLDEIEGRKPDHTQTVRLNDDDPIPLNEALSQSLKDNPEGAQVDPVGGLEALETDAIPPEFRALMLDGESPAKFTERMKRRMIALKHLQMDGAKPTPSRALPDMTEEEAAELADLEERNKISRWLD